MNLEAAELMRNKAAALSLAAAVPANSTGERNGLARAMSVRRSAKAKPQEPSE